MKSFVVGVGATYTAAALAVLGLDPAARGNIEMSCAVLLLIGLLPTAVAVGALLVIQRTRPRLRLFAASQPGHFARFIRGSGAALIGLGCSLAAMVWLTPLPPDPVTIAVGAAVGVVLVAAPGRRIPRGACAKCGYDLTGLTASSGGRCPECGQAVAAISGPAGITGDAIVALACTTPR